MLLEEMLRDERSLGREEGLQEGEMIGSRKMLLKFLSGLGPVPSELQRQIEEEKDVEKLGTWIMVAAKAHSIQEFHEKICKTL